MKLPDPAPFPKDWPHSPDDTLENLTMPEQAIVRSLVRLDAALVSYSQDKKRGVLPRLWNGVIGHLKSRVAEWFATALLIQFGYILYSPEEVFPHAPNLAVMAQMASEQTWGIICLAVGAIHLLALTINGTFPSFRFSPHVRAAASFIACFLWFQITISIFLSGIGGTGLGTYRLVFILEFWNFLNASQDVGASEGRRDYNVR